MFFLWQFFRIMLFRMIWASEVLFPAINPSWLSDSILLWLVNKRSLLFRTDKNSFPKHDTKVIPRKLLRSVFVPFLCIGTIVPITHSGTISLDSNIELNSNTIISGWQSSKLWIISLLMLSIPRALPGFNIIDAVLISSNI